MTSKVSNLLLIIKLNPDVFDLCSTVRCSTVDCRECPFNSKETMEETLTEIQKGEHHV